METPESLPPPETEEPYFEPEEEAFVRPGGGGFWALGGRLTWVAGLVLAVSSFTDWYAGPSDTGPTLAVIGWHTGALGKLVFFVGLAVLALVALREAGFELPPAVPESLVVIALGSLAMIFVLVVTADLAADGIAYELREAVDRRRPPLVYAEPEPLVRVPHQPSFPSGHAATAFACATVIAATAPRLRIPAFVLAAAIAWSRVYVGVHWPLDVLGGAALGVVVATALLTLAEALRRSLRARRAG